MVCNHHRDLLLLQVCAAPYSPEQLRFFFSELNFGCFCRTLKLWLMSQTTKSQVKSRCSNNSEVDLKEIIGHCRLIKEWELINKVANQAEEVSEAQIHRKIRAMELEATIFQTRVTTWIMWQIGSVVSPQTNLQEPSMIDRAVWSLSSIITYPKK